MAVLTDEARAQIWKEFMQEAKIYGELSITKQQLRQVFNDLDVWFNDNAGNINAAISQPMRQSLSTNQKIAIARAVLQKRLEERSDG